MSKIVNIVLDAIESRARIVDKNGKSYIQLRVTQSFTFTRSSDYVGECLYRAFIKYLNIVIVVIKGERNPTSTKGRTRWKSSSENYLLITEVRFRVRFRVMVRARVRV